MISKPYWDQFLQNKILVLGENLYNNKSSKKQLFYEVWTPNQNKKSKGRSEAKTCLLWQLSVKLPLKCQCFSKFHSL